jgi:hypothetical protein
MLVLMYYENIWNFFEMNLMSMEYSKCLMSIFVT